MSFLFSYSPITYIGISTVSGLIAIASAYNFTIKAGKNAGLPLAYIMSFDNPYQTSEQRSECDDFFKHKIISIILSGIPAIFFSGISVSSFALATITHAHNVLNN